MTKKEQKAVVVGLAALIILIFLFMPRQDSVMELFFHQFTEVDWQEVKERNVVKNSIPIILLETTDGKCKVQAQMFDRIIDHPYFARSAELVSKLSYDRENETLILPCHMVKDQKSRLNIWYVKEESPTHSKKFQYFVTPWAEQ